MTFTKTSAGIEHPTDEVVNTVVEEDAEPTSRTPPRMT
jgi:hypothetical protein